MDWFIPVSFKPEKPRSYSYPRVRKRAQMPSNGLFATECDVLESPSSHPILIGECFLNCGFRARAALLIRMDYIDQFGIGACSLESLFPR